MRADYRSWLAAQEYAENTQVTQMHRVAKVEQYYGSLDDIFAEGSFDALISDLTYSTHDERQGKPNPSKIVFDGNIRNNLQSYKNAAMRYRSFLQAIGLVEAPSTAQPRPPFSEAVAVDAELPAEKQRLSLERDMQAALRRDIHLLEHGLQIIDDGAERGVTSGFIDILCHDSTGRTVVVELKAGKTDHRVVAQILGYMGDLVEEDELREVRGIIVAHEFDRRTISAVKAVPNLSLMRYSISFRFEPESGS